MNWFQTLCSIWLRAVGAAPPRALSRGTEIVGLRRLSRRRLDARGLQGLLGDAFSGRAAAPPDVEEPPRKAVGS